MVKPIRKIEKYNKKKSSRASDYVTKSVDKVHVLLIKNILLSKVTLLNKIKPKFEISTTVWY